MADQKEVSVLPPALREGDIRMVKDLADRAVYLTVRRVVVGADSTTVYLSQGAGKARPVYYRNNEPVKVLR